MNLFYREHRPSDILKPFVYCYWSLYTDGSEEEYSDLQRCFPSGLVEYIVTVRGKRMIGYFDGCWKTYPQAIFTGMFDQAAIWASPGASELFGIRFTPEGAIRIFGNPVSEFRNSFLSADEYGGVKARRLTDELISSENLPRRLFQAEKFLCEEVKKRPLQEDYLSEALQMLRSRDDLNIRNLSRDVFVCERQLQRSFKHMLGITPKHYYRLMRLYKAHNMGLLKKENFTDMAYRLGYADQAHFTKDFKNYFGLSPSHFFGTTSLKLIL